MAEERDEAIALPIVYVGVEEAPLYFSNQFVVQWQQDEFVLTFGHVTPPLEMVGLSLDQARERARTLRHVEAKLIVRLGMTAARVRELVRLLQQQLAAYDRQRGEAPQSGQ